MSYSDFQRNLLIQNTFCNLRKYLFDALNMTHDWNKDYGINFTLQQSEHAILRRSGELSGSHKKRLGAFTFSTAKINHPPEGDNVSPSMLKPKLLSKPKKNENKEKENENEEQKMVQKPKISQSQKPLKVREKQMIALRKIRSYAFQLLELRAKKSTQSENCSPEMSEIEKEIKNCIDRMPNNEEQKINVCKIDDFNLMREESIQAVFTNIQNISLAISCELIKPEDKKEESKEEIKKIEFDRTTPPLPLLLARESSYYTKISDGSLTDEDMISEDKTKK